MVERTEKPSRIFGDVDFPVNLKTQKGGSGGWVYLSGLHIAEALLGKGKAFERVDTERVTATRTVLDPGTGQVLIRLKRKGPKP